jgi:hypothetical protein
MTMKKCEDISKQLIAYLDRRADSADRAELEAHLASCATCHARAEEFRALFGAMERIETIEPSAGFDARLRERIAVETKPGWLHWLVPQPRLAFSMALLLALSVWMAKLPRDNSGSMTATAGTEQQDFEAIKDLGVLENYDVLSKFDALSEIPADAAPADEQAKPVDQNLNQNVDPNAQQQPANEE